MADYCEMVSLSASTSAICDVSSWSARLMRFARSLLGSRWRAQKGVTTGRPSLAIVTCIKDEGEDLVEWLCFHRLIGVSQFVIYDNLSTDKTRSILQAVPFGDEITVHSVADEWPQKAAFRDAIERYRNKLDWVAFLDADEFIVPLGAGSMLDKLTELQERGANGFGIHWRIFGTGGHEVRPPGLVTESFTKRAVDSFTVNRHVKSLVRLSSVQKMVTQHYFRVDGDYFLDSGSPPPDDFEGVASEATFTQGFAIHHYITKSREQCLTKIARGRPRPSQSDTKYRSKGYLTVHDRNEVDDRRAADVIAPIHRDILMLRQDISTR